ncbi:MAG: nicotinamide-nucleotide amidohydrolase family protein [Chloroflexi bacterium]|nr:nicotinamide-nucleotide amidohydrolase family protein [Chloroflexota bacterium]
MLDPALVALAERLQGICVGRHLTVATAESCTGGLVAETITAVPGSSAYYVGGVVSYADAVKRDLLDVPVATLAAHGAVSAQVAKAMALGCRARLGTSLAVSITGIAGPDGGSEAKPVGLTYIGLATRGSDDATASAEVHRFVLPGDRAAIRASAAAEALQWLITTAEASS